MEKTEIDRMIRDPTVQRLDIARQLGLTPTGLYGALREQYGVKVATISFLVNDKTGKPLCPLTKAEVEAAGRAAIAKTKPTVAS